jgi:uncharacterized protein (TIGR02466 family)
MDIQDMFGLPVAIHKMETLDCPKMIEFLDKQTLTGKEGIEGEYTLNQQILEYNIFKEAKEEITRVTRLFAQEAVGHLIEDILIATSWANISEDNRHVRPHSHCNSYLSGVFYLTDGANLNMFNPFKRTDMYMVNPAIAFQPENKFTWQSISITPEPGMLVMFPSGLTHSVDPAPTRRYSIAYNTVPKGVIGREAAFINIQEVDNTANDESKAKVDPTKYWVA